MTRKKVDSLLPPPGTTEQDVVASMQSVYITHGAAAAIRYARSCEVTAHGSWFNTAAGNVLMAKLALIHGDATGYHYYRNIALGECADFSDQDKVKLAQMYQDWTQKMHVFRLLPLKWQLELTENLLRREYLLT